jgi:hypothetical protein
MHPKAEELRVVLRAGDDTLRGDGAALAGTLQLFARVREAMGAYADDPTPARAEQLRLMASALQSAGPRLDAARGIESYVADTLSTAEHLLEVLESVAK